MALSQGHPQPRRVGFARRSWAGFEWGWGRWRSFHANTFPHGELGRESRQHFHTPSWESEGLILALVERALPAVILFRSGGGEIKLPRFTLMFLLIFSRTDPFSLNFPYEKCPF